MRPPFVEALPLLAAHGRPIVPIRRWRPAMPDARFALFTKIDPVTKPRVFPDLDSLARAIEREREGAALELVDFEGFEFEGDDRGRLVVEVWALDAGNNRDRLIGRAWCDGRSQDALRSALRRARDAAAQASDSAEAA